MQFFIVAIIGRPNVGKSTLFNALIEKKRATKAIVRDIPGLTRDRKEGFCKITKEHKIKIIDTGGLEAEGPFAEAMQEQSLMAMQEADMIFFMLDSKVGILPEDHHWLLWLHKNRGEDKKVFILVNKSDVKDNKIDDSEILEIGFHQILRISAERKQGLREIHELIKKNFLFHERSFEEQKKEENIIKLAIIGRPNVGKSTFLNSILGQKRMIVSEIAGTTHDSVESDFQFNDKIIRICDTAGLRKKKRISAEVETLITKKSLEMINNTHIVALMMDATMPLEKQDLILGQRVCDEGRGLVIVINKFDLVTDQKKYMEQFRQVCAARITLKNVAIVTISALNDQNCKQVLKKCAQVFESFNTKIPTSLLNRWLMAQVESKAPPLNQHKKATKLKFMNQVAIRPPKFNIFGNTLQHLQGSHYESFLNNNLSKDFDLQGVPIRINFISSNNPYREKKS